MRGVLAGEHRLQGDKDGGLRDAGAEAGREDVEGLEEIGRAVPAQEEKEVAEGREGYSEEDEGFVCAGAGGAC